MTPDLSDLVSEYLSSERFHFLEPSLKEHAEKLLYHWASQVSGEVTDKAIEDSLYATARLDLSSDIRRQVPLLLREFFDAIAGSGRHPPAAAWAATVARLEPSYLARLRADGSVKGETYEKKYTNVGRNDPCPCGSGLKFKKCCMKLIG